MREVQVIASGDVAASVDPVAPAAVATKVPAPKVSPYQAALVIVRAVAVKLTGVITGTIRLPKAG